MCARVLMPRESSMVNIIYTLTCGGSAAATHRGHLQRLDGQQTVRARHWTGAASRSDRFGSQPNSMLSLPMLWHVVTSKDPCQFKVQTSCGWWTYPMRSRDQKVLREINGNQNQNFHVEVVLLAQLAPGLLWASMSPSRGRERLPFFTPVRHI